MKVLFMGRKQVAADCLEWLVHQPGVEIVSVLTDSDVAGSCTAERARRFGLRLIDHDTQDG